MELRREQIRFMITKDLMFRGPIWALLILTIWGLITIVMFWVLLNVIKPSIDKRIEDSYRTIQVQEKMQENRGELIYEFE